MDIITSSEGYCGFAEWPACPAVDNLAATGGDPAVLATIAVVGLGFLALGLVAERIAARRNRI